MNPYLIQGPALISFSGGRTSAKMLKKILDAHGGTLPDNVVVGFANTGRERPETLDFVQECSSRWNVRIVWLEYDPTAEHNTRIVSHNSASRNGEPFEALIAKRKMLPNPAVSFCTIELKIRRFREYAVHWLGWDKWISVVGLRADEESRVKKQMRRNKAGKDRWKTVCPLHTAGVTKQHVSDFWKMQPFDLRLLNVRGKTPDGNCDLCFKKGMVTIKSTMRRHPECIPWWVRMEANAPGLATMRNPDMALFRADRPSYAALADQVARQGDFEDLGGEEESVDCGCTD